MVPKASATPSHLAIEPLIIAAPFGNYIQPSGATATLGTFTSERRGNGFSYARRVLQTVRFYPRMRAWVHRTELGNPGIEWLVKRVRSGRIDVSDKLVSVRGFDNREWYTLLDRIADLQPLAVELHLGWPEAGHLDWPLDLFGRARATGAGVVVKLPPVAYEAIVEQAYAAGVTHLHCCNALPVAAGAMSGAPLKPLSLTCIRALRQRSYGPSLTLIGGGGIYSPADMDDYARASADRVAVATGLLQPGYLVARKPFARLIERAQTLFPKDAHLRHGHRHS